MSIHLRVCVYVCGCRFAYACIEAIKWHWMSLDVFGGCLACYLGIRFPTLVLLFEQQMLLTTELFIQSHNGYYMSCFKTCTDENSSSMQSTSKERSKSIWPRYSPPSVWENASKHRMHMVFEASFPCSSTFTWGFGTNEVSLLSLSFQEVIQ